MEAGGTAQRTPGLASPNDSVPRRSLRSATGQGKSLDILDPDELVGADQAAIVIQQVGVE
jgi:hypothetical protein